MPITKELKNIQKPESVGFDHKQAETLADIIEQSHADSQEDLKEFFRNELDGKINNLSYQLDGKTNNLRNELEDKINNQSNEFNTRFNELDKKIEKILSVTENLDTYIKAGQYDLLIKIIAVVTGTAGILFGLLKIFP